MEELNDTIRTRDWLQNMLEDSYKRRQILISRGDHDSIRFQNISNHIDRIQSQINKIDDVISIYVFKKLNDLLE